MRTGSIAFRLVLGLAWLLLFLVSLQAVRAMGAGAAGAVFFGDMAHPWRAQFNTDFGLHLLLVAAWMVYRSRSLAFGILCGVLAVVLGGVFTFAYIIVVLSAGGGDVRRLLLGRHLGEAATPAAVSPAPRAP